MHLCKGSSYFQIAWKVFVFAFSYYFTVPRSTAGGVRSKQALIYRTLRNTRTVITKGEHGAFGAGTYILDAGSYKTWA